VLQRWLWPIAGATVAFLLARYLSYDPYYAPSLRRMSDGGLVSPEWVAFVCVAAAATAATARRGPRLATAVIALLMWTSALTALAMGLGH
jgi:hypothetical protein